MPIPHEDPSEGADKPDADAFEVVTKDATDDLEKAESKDAATSDSEAEMRGKLTIQQRINLFVNGTIEKGFDKLGRFIGRRPRLTMVLAVILCLACASGISQLENEERGEKLWLPKGTLAVEHAEFIEANYPAFADTQNLFVQYSDKRSVLTPEAFDEAYRLFLNTTTWVAWDNLEDGQLQKEGLPDRAFYSDLCLNRNSGRGAADVSNCRATNVLALFSYEPTNWDSTEKILTRINTPELWDTTTLGDGVVTEGLLGGLTENAEGQVVEARTISLTFFLWANQTLIDEQKEDDAVNGWEGAWLDMVEAEEASTEGFTLPRFASRSFDDEFGATIDNDVLLLQVALFAIALFTGLALSDFKQGCVGSRASLTVAGLLSIAMAVVSCYGLGSYFGLIFSPLMTVLPFIMLGVGVDGIFVLQFALDATDPTLPIEERMADTLRHAGVSVTLASLTNFFAFLIGSNTSLPALSAFSVYAALGILFDLIYQITFFAGVMRLDIQRQDRRALDVLCCVETCEEPEAGCCYGICGEGFPKRRLSVRAMSFVGRLLKSKIFRAAIVAAWLGLLTVGIIGTSRMKVDADVNDFIPDGSYLNEYFDTVQNDFDQGTGDSGALYFVNSAEAQLDFSTPAIQAQMETAITLLEANEWIVADTVDAWWTAFKDANNGVVSQDTFWVDLDAFLASPAGKFYAGDIVFYEDHAPPAVNTGIYTCRFTFEFVYLEDTDDQIDAMDSTRAITQDVPAPLGTNAFVYGASFQQIEQYKTIGREAVMNLGLGMLMIAVVIIILLANLVASVITFVCVVSAIVELVGVMNFLGFYIDSVTVIFLVISLGLAVDYSVHVAHGFLANRDKDIGIRLQHTMEQTGSSVINGAISTLIAALCLAGSGSYVFITFFYALLFIVVFGAFSGLFVLPVLLSIFKPRPHVVAVNTRTKKPTTTANLSNLVDRDLKSR